ncbi:amidohydrolase [Pedobacter yulinensis]|uniref:Amidohydrolase n=1 Tax=Pedobacter yulinensis TaxID=2126353 RepID=A0A2T3HP00_9SPHI|nr:amidohydrolase [Pedobacter yulinensis]PST84174.1 amidohydrolase [Pedobacter yulinensis]
MKLFAWGALLCMLCSCAGERADLLVYNARIYTVNERFDTAGAMAVRDGKILAVGSAEALRKKYDATEQLDAGGKTIYPGFIDAHAHFFGYGKSLYTADLRGTKSWKEVCDRLVDFAKSNPEGWLTGGGWDQNDWPDKQFPDKAALDSLFPKRPVLLERIDGHAAIANQAALAAAGINDARKLIGGEIISRNGQLTGLLIDNAVGLVAAKVPEPDAAQWQKILSTAEKNCFAAGLTTIDDCGLDYQATELIEALHKKGALKMRMYVMLSDKPENYDYLFKRGIIKTPRLNVRSFKVYADGALGSRGAALLADYHDSPGKKGFLLSEQQHFRRIAGKLANSGFQMCTHAIGDSANRTILKIYSEVLKGKNDKRWRIEHAQVVNPADFSRFGAAGIVPSVQPTHATSDMYWAADRLGPERVKGAYAYKQLLKQNGWIPLGTDFPVEQIDPMLTFYAATARRDASGFPANGFQTENGLSREEALRGMTIWAAKANFEEKEKGSLEPGKLADFVILDQDILKVPQEKLLNIKVLKTYLNGEKVYEKK